MRASAEKIAMERGWLSRQPGDFRRRVLEGCLLEEFERGEAVYHLGDPPGGIYGIVTGALALSIAPGDTGPYFAHIANPGDWFGEAPFLTGEPRRIGLEAATKCTLLNLPLYAMERMAAEDSMAIRRFAQIAVLNADLAVSAIADLMISNPERRIAAVLVRVGGALREPIIRVSQSELGAMANASRKVVNRALHRFEEHSWVEPSYNAIKIRDAQALKDFAAARR